MRTSVYKVDAASDRRRRENVPWHIFVLALHINSWSGGPILILRKTKTPGNERLPGVHENSYFIFEKQIMWSDTR